MVLVFGESGKSRADMRAIRQWKIGDAFIGERDHLGILWSVSDSTIGHVFVMTTLARSAFYAIQSVGPRFGLLHPLTSLKLFRAYSLCILSYVLEVLSPTMTELSSSMTLRRLPTHAQCITFHQAKEI